MLDISTDEAAMESQEKSLWAMLKSGKDFDIDASKVNERSLRTLASKLGRESGIKISVRRIGKLYFEVRFLKNRQFDLYAFPHDIFPSSAESQKEDSERAFNLEVFSVNIEIGESLAISFDDASDNDIRLMLYALRHYSKCKYRCIKWDEQKLYEVARIA